MGKFLDALETVGKVLEAHADLNRDIDQMTSELMRRGYDLDLTATREVARILVTQAEVTWK